MPPKWEAWGSQKGAKKDPKMGYPPRTPPREGLGRFLDGFGEDFGRFLEGCGRILGGFSVKFGKVFELILEGGFVGVLDGFGEDFGRFLNEFGRILGGF